MSLLGEHVGIPDDTPLMAHRAASLIIFVNGSLCVVAPPATGRRDTIEMLFERNLVGDLPDVERADALAEHLLGFGLAAAFETLGLRLEAELNHVMLDCRRVPGVDPRESGSNACRQLVSRR